MVLHATLHRRLGCYALLAFAAALVGTEWAVARGTPAGKCAAARYRLVGKLVRAEMACDVIAVAGKRPVDASCATRAEAKFASAWRRTESSGACVAGTAAPITAELQRVRAELRARLHPVTTPSRCVAGKVDRAARYAAARLACDGRAAKKGLPPTHGTVLGCLATARARLGSAFQRLEARSDCQSVGDSAAVGETLDGFVVCVGVAVSGNDAGTCGTTTTTTTTSSSTTAGPATTLPVTTTSGGVTTTTTTSLSPTTTTVTSTTTTTTTTTTGGGGTSTTTTITTTTSTTLLPCGGIYPLCLGSCPEGQECTGDALAETCACATTTTTTSTASTTTSTLLACGGLYPLCLGSCPDGETCTAGGLAEPCTCAPVTTTTTSTASTTTSSTLLGCGGLVPACLGSCPDGETCGGENLLDPCTCTPIATTTTAPPTTTTTAGATTTTSTTTTSTTTSTLLPCGGLHPVCLGSCPDGETCSGENLLDPCTCTPITTTTTATSTTTTTLLPCGGIAPACLGSCPPGQSCSGPLLGACSCQ